MNQKSTSLMASQCTLYVPLRHKYLFSKKQMLPCLGRLKIYSISIKESNRSVFAIQMNTVDHMEQAVHPVESANGVVHSQRSDMPYMVLNKSLLASTI